MRDCLRLAGMCFVIVEGKVLQGVEQMGDEELGSIFDSETLRTMLMDMVETAEELTEAHLLDFAFAAFKMGFNTAMVMVDQEKVERAMLKKPEIH